jgi:O-antigen ligase
MWKIAVALFFLYAFLLTSRMLDVLGNSFKIAAVLLALLAIALVVSRRAFTFWQTPAGKTMPVFAAWVVATWFLASHPMGSARLIQKILEGVVLFAASGLLANVGDFRKLFGTLAGAGLVEAGLGILWGKQSYGRLALRSGPDSDPNYYAMALLAIIPLIWSLVAGQPWRMRLLGLLAGALPVAMLIRTGSRASFVAMGAMVVVLFFLASLTGRILIVSLAAVAFVILVAFVPNVLKSRLGGADTERSGADKDSANARGTLLGTGVALTIENPIFGIGPGNFAEMVVEEGRARGVEWAPLGPHNAYTQISSETGFPGILLFLLLMGFSFQNVISVLRQTGPSGELYPFACGLLVSLAGTCTFIFFLGEAYNSVLYFWLGLASGLRLALPEPEEEDE